MTLTGYRASPTAVTLTAPSGPGWRHRRRDRPERRACAACEIPGRPRVLPPDELVIQSGGPLAAGAAHREGGRNTVKARKCVTTQDSEVEDRDGATAELAARFSAAIRTSLASLPDQPGLWRLTLLPNSGCCIRTYLCAGLHVTTVTTIVNSALSSFV